jgi:hypothetical protein
MDISLIVQHSSSRAAHVGRKRGIESVGIYFDKSRPLGFELETSGSDTVLATLYQLVAPKSLS